MNRADRLNARFKLIQQSIAELHGGDLAFAAASAGWLMAIQYGAKQSMERVAGIDEDVLGFLITELDTEHESMLRGYHEELCSFLNVDPARALELSKSFEQVVQDICFQGG